VIAYISRRLGMMLLIVFGASFMVYNLQAISSNPLEVFAESTAKNKEQQMAQMILELKLDVPPPLRYFIWFRGIIAGLWGQLDLGQTRDNFLVMDSIAAAIPITFRLVIASTILAILFGITIGMITAIRQYSRFDYTMTFVSFLLFSLPIFWVAVLLKEYMAIEFNDFLANPRIPIEVVVVVGLIGGFIVAGVIGGTRKKFLANFAGVSIAVTALVFAMSASNWFTDPGLGIIGVSILSFAAAALIVQLTTGLDNRASLRTSLIAASIVTIGYYPIQLVLGPESGIWSVVLTFSITIATSSIIGYFAHAEDKKTNTRTGALTAFVGTFVLMIDRTMQEFNGYMYSDAIGGRPVSTIDQANPKLSPEQMESFWISGLDAVMHLILPTVALTLVSFAGYVRFSRGSLLEVLNMDFIRTARAKGLTERTVLTRHAMRNAMLPLTTILVNDFAGVIGGAIITESIFQWKGMGSLFNQALRTYDLNLLMGVFIIGAVLTIVANLVADLLYGVVDPRIRIRK
jgi:peptide/nickel transport system permease protein